MAPAGAYPRESFWPVTCNGDDGTATYYFSDAVEVWEAAEKTAVAGGFNDWEAVEQYTGAALVDISAGTASSHEVIVYRRPLVNGSTTLFGWTFCLPGVDSIELKSNLTDAEFEHVARHEMGHELTLNHTGTTDSFGGGVETMAPCDSDTNTSASQDDHGNLIHKHTPLVPATITANDGFEQASPLQWWGTSSVASFTYSSSSPHSGTYGARFTPSLLNGSVYTSMNYAAAAGKQVDARTWVRKVSSLSTTGTVVLETWARSVTYAALDGCGDWLTGKNQNSRLTPGAWVIVRAESLTPTTTWAALTEASPYSLGSYDAMDLRVVVKSGARFSDGTYASIAIDDTRLRDQS
jgi:hypothetical protein